MRTALKLEAIDDHIVARYSSDPRAWPKWKDKPLRPYVARLCGLSKKFGYDREFIEGKKDYSAANGKGSRGVWIHYALEEGVYEIQELRPRRKPDRYLARVEDGGLRRIEEREAKQWLLENTILELMCLLQRGSESPGLLTPSLESALASLAEKIHPSCCTSSPTKLEDEEGSLDCCSLT